MTFDQGGYVLASLYVLLSVVLENFSMPLQCVMACSTWWMTFSVIPQRYVHCRQLG